MPQRFLTRLRTFFEGNPAVDKVADDPAVAAELVLLLRLIVADGSSDREEINRFREIVGKAFGIGDDDMGEVIEYLKEFAYETDADQAAALFAEMAPERKTELLKHMLSVAEADHALDIAEMDFIRRTAEILGVTSEDLKRDAGR